MKSLPQYFTYLLHGAYLEDTPVTDDGDIVFLAVEETLKILAEIHSSRGVNTYLSTHMHRRVYEVLGEM